MSTYLGQNFLKDSKIISYIKKTITDLYQHQSCSTIVEIGPGKGAITKHLVNIPDRLIVIEKDEKMVPYIEKLSDQHSGKTIDIIHSDVLEVDVADLLEKNNTALSSTLVVGNLPYYITSPIIRKFFGEERSRYASGFFMMQKEVGDKIRHDADKKSYLRWLCNFAHTVRYSKTVPAKAFNPPPKVQSCLMSFIPKATPEGFAKDFDNLLKLLDAISPYKRKTLGKIWKMNEKKDPSFSYELPEELKSKRLEQIGWEEMIKILK